MVRAGGEARDPAEIRCSTRLGVFSDRGEVASRAAAAFDTGVDVLVVALNAPNDGDTVARLAPALADVS